MSLVLRRLSGIFLFLFITSFLGSYVWAWVGGSISGTVTDQTGAVIPKATVTVKNTAQGTELKTTTDGQGVYSFPNLAVGRYDLTIEADGFKAQKKSGLVIDVDTALEATASLEIKEIVSEVGVTVAAEAEEIRVETISTQVGDVLTNTEMTSVALNGRSFTDLLALQPGIVPMTTQQPDSIVMAGASVAIAPSGSLNAGNQSISGQREDANGFMVNGGDVKELMNGGTTVVPNLDSIEEFRILTNNFDSEYGNYSGGVVNVITKAGTNNTHGSAFEFLRNTALDARNFFSAERGVFRQNQFGGTIGGPIVKQKMFYFGDYQGTRNTESVDTGLISVPSFANRSGNLADQSGSLTGTVISPFFASELSSKLGYAVASGEPYYRAGCVTTTQCVFPNAVIPMNVWSEPAKHLLQYIPTPNSGSSSFSTSAEAKRLRDDKGSFRVDYVTNKLGTLSGYYFLDDYNLDNPYPSGQGGASVPGFNALTFGRAQLINIGDTKTFGNSIVNEFHFSYMRSANVLSKPQGGVGVKLADQGFVTGPGTPGIVVLDPSIEGVENVVFSSFVMGVPITNLTQANNTYVVNNSFSKVWGPHSIKAGLEFSYEQVNVDPNPTFNGSFAFFGSETGSDFADFLLGIASNYNQADSQSYYPRHKYAAAFVQDSWRVKPGWTFNYGLRLDVMRYWSEKYNQIPTLKLGQQSEVFPDAPASIVYPTDKGIPETLVPGRNRYSPRLGLAYSPQAKDGWIAKLTGGPGNTSVRAGFGLFYSVIEGNTVAIDEPQPPYGLSYTSPGPPLFATPFVNAADGSTHVQPFPMTFPPLNTTIDNPTTGIDFSQFVPIAGLSTPNNTNTYPYNENYFLSIQRKFGMNTLFTIGYAGSQAHHLLVVHSANPGDPALCLSLSQPTDVAPGTPTCGPFSEDTQFIRANGQIVNGTRGPLGSAFSNDTYQSSIGNSNFNSLQTSLAHEGRRINYSLSYTYSKSIDTSSSIADPVNPYHFEQTRALSAFDLKHNFVATFQFPLPFGTLFGGKNSLTSGWMLTGIQRFSTGFPVTMSADGDNSLIGSIPNGVNNKSLDLPDQIPGPLNLNSNPRNGLEYFNTSLFSENALGTPGNANRRYFYGPGMVNSDLALLRRFHLSESKVLEFRWETFNTFNHAQFFGPAAVNGDIDSNLFGQVVKAAPPRLMQFALKLSF
jgi:hypothetical protein